MKRAIIIHGWSGYPGYCWFPWVKKELEAKGFGVQVPAMPDTDAPNLATWLPTLQDTVGTPDEDLYLIGHSAGAITILRYLESLAPSQKIGGAILVAGFTHDLGYKELSNFYTTELPLEKIRKKANHFTVILSDNDPYVPVSEGEIFKEKLGADVIVLHDMKHFSGPVDKEDSCTELPEVVQSIQKMLY